MRETYLEIKEALNGGLRREPETVKSAVQLTTCKNFRCSERGLLSPVRLQMPGFSPFGSQDWPFPQFYQGRKHRLVLERERILSVSGDWKPSRINTYNLFDPEYEKAIPAGGVWHVADFGDTYMLFNGSCSVSLFKDIKAKNPLGDRVCVQDTVTIQSGCSFRGRGVFGGFDAGDFWASGGGADLVADEHFDFGDDFWIPGVGWQIVDNSAQLASNASNPLSQPIASLQVGRRYMVRYEVKGIPAEGYVVAVLGGTQGQIRTSTGTFEEEITPSIGGAIAFYARGTEEQPAIIDHVTVRMVEDRSVFWTNWASQLAPKVRQDLTMGENFVWWSAIGGGDILWLFLRTLMASGQIESPYDENMPLVMDYLQRGDMGFMPMPWPGKVLCVKPLGKVVVVYGEHGISALVPAMEPLPAFGLQEIASFGVAARGAIDGDDRQHVFLDSSGTLWTMGQDLQPQRLGYREYLSSLLGKVISFSHEANENRFYLAAGADGEQASQCYLLEKGGLSEVTQQPSSVAFVDGGSIGTFAGLEADYEDLPVLLETGIFDMGQRSIKVVRSVQVESEGIENLQVALWTRYTPGGDFVMRRWVRVNNQGVATVQTSGLDFKLTLQGTAGEGASLGRISLSWGLADGREIRSQYV
jgi:hypothetical protein